MTPYKAQSFIMYSSVMKPNSQTKQEKSHAALRFLAIYFVLSF